MEDNKLVLFQENTIRKEWNEGEWWFSIVDVIAVLTDSNAPQKYWTKVKRKLTEEGFFELTTNSSVLKKLKMQAADGKKYATDASNTEGVLRLIMSVPSPKAEPFKRWLAQVGKERIDEIENPELTIERAREIYRAKGYSDEWIETRIKSLDIRKQLTDEWKQRGVKEGQEYSILTAEIAKATFGVTPQEHKNIKGLEKENLRDHMTNLELIFTMLGEESTRRIAVKEDSQGFNENLEAAQSGGFAAGEARKRYEQTIGESIVSPENFKKQIEEAEKQDKIE